MIPVGTEVRFSEATKDIQRTGTIIETGLNTGSGTDGEYSNVRFADGSTLYIYDRKLELTNSTRSNIAMKLNLSGNVKEFLVRASYVNPAQGIRETREFDTEAQAKDYAARSVVDGNKGAEAYIYKLDRVARLPLPEVDWQANKKGE